MKVKKVCADLPSLRSGFVSVYKEAFGGPPYYEKYEDTEVVNDIWLPHVKKGLVVLASEGEKTIGFSCSMPFSESPVDVQTYLLGKKENNSLSLDVRAIWYNSELGVETPYRKKGVGYALMRVRLAEIVASGGEYYVARTASVGSNSLHLYERIGSVKLPGSHNVSISDQVIVNKSQSTERIYLYGSCKEAIREIDVILTE